LWLIKELPGVEPAVLVADSYFCVEEF